MSSELIKKALKTADDTQDIRFGDGVTVEAGSMFQRLFPGARVLVVADENTFAATGDAVVRSLTQAGVVLAGDPYVFPGSPTLYADYDNVTLLREYLSQHTNTVICVVGAGTLNDIAKLASGELNRPYMVVCTAASVDGFASFGASISKDGFKITRNCPAPAGIIADNYVTSKAPARLTATGYGDLIEKVPAGADWILADALGIEAIDQDVWMLVQDPLRDALDNPELVGQGDVRAIEKLMEGSLMSGLAMQASKSSRPASGAGHQFSHTWEMEGHGLDEDPPLSHGFKVGIGTIASCALWEEFLELEVDDFDLDRALERAKSEAEVETEIRELLVPRMQEGAIQHSLRKHPSERQLRDRIAKLSSIWPNLRPKLREQLMPAEEIMRRLRVVGAPHHPQLIGIDQDRLRQTYFKARLIRDRYTIFDVLYDLGIFEDVVNRLFIPTGFWGRHAIPTE